MDNLLSNNLLLISVLVFVTISAMALWIFHYANYIKERKRLINKIRGLVSEDRAEGRETETGKGFFLSLAARLGRRLKPSKPEEMSKIKKKLSRAGFRGAGAVTVFLGSRVLLALAFVALVLAVRLPLPTPVSGFRFTIALLAAAAIGFYLPRFFLNLRASGRKRRITNSFPDALDLMVVCVEAGMGLDAAISRVGEEIRYTSAELSEEFRLLSLELRAGKPRREALRNLAARVDVEDVTSLVSLLIQTDKFGTEVAQALRVYSDSMRSRRQLRAEEKAEQLPTKLVFPLIFFLLPVVFILVAGPAVVRIVRMFANR